jgi:hypothetical protein
MLCAPNRPPRAQSSPSFGVQRRRGDDDRMRLVADVEQPHQLRRVLAVVHRVSSDAHASLRENIGWNVCVHAGNGGWNSRGRSGAACSARRGRSDLRQPEMSKIIAPPSM